MKNRMMVFVLASLMVSLGSSLSASACGDHEESAKSSQDSLNLASAHSEAADAKNLANSRFKVEGISCGGCEKMISAKLQAVEGVKSVQFYNAKDSASKKSAHFLKVSYVSGSVTNEAILKAVASAGDHFKVTPVAN